MERAGLNLKSLLAALILLLPPAAGSRPVDSAQAARAVGKWAASRPEAHLGAVLGSSVSEVSSVPDGTGRILFHVVRLENGGVVVTAPDDRIAPIVAFSEDGDIDRDSGNPFWFMLNKDMPKRIEAVEEAAARQSSHKGLASSPAAASPFGLAESLWADLLSDEPHPADGNVQPVARGVSSVPDVRVGKLLSTKWSQSTAGGGNCYNYYTPNHYVCGCVATAGAQLLKYHEFPRNSISGGTFPCWVDDSPASYKMKGGSYAWSDMPDAPGSSLTETQRQAIGKLCYDVGVASRMNWTSGGSGATPLVLASSLSSVFGFSNVRCYCSSAITDGEIKNAIYANLDAGCPVLLGINNDAHSAGHEIVADGYGYYSGCLYTHLNFGWAGSSDAWYALPDMGTGYNYSIINAVIYNVFPDSTGELLTGRITDSSGNPLSVVTVAAASGSATATATTNSKGIYALKIPGGKRWSLSVTKPGYENASATVYLPSSISTSLAAVYADSYSYYLNGSVGNSWGNDMTLSPIAARADLLPSGFYVASPSGFDAVSSFERGDGASAVLAVSNSGGTDVTVPFSVIFEVLTATGVLKESMVAECTSGIPAGGEWTVRQPLGSVPGLEPGDYVCRCTVDSGGSVAESDEMNNAASFAFSVRAPAVTLSSISISGADEISPASNSRYVCTARMSDGTSRPVSPVWSVSSGAAYASVDQSGTVSAGVHEARHAIILRASYTLDGIVKTATKTISILPAIPLKTALGNPALDFTTGGDATWFGQDDRTCRGAPSARSGVVGDNGVSWLEATATGPGTLSFAFTVSSEARFDMFRFMVDGDVEIVDSGTGYDSLDIWRTYDTWVPAGTHVFRWTFEKDVSLSAGMDAAFLADVSWIADEIAPVAISISGPDAIDAESCADYICLVEMSDGSRTAATPAWSIESGASLAVIDSSGRLSAFSSATGGTVVIAAEYASGQTVKRTTKSVTVNGVLPMPGATTVYGGRGDGDSAIVRWTPAGHASGYRIWRSTSQSRPAQPLDSVSGVLMYADTAAEPGVSYFYWVSAVNARGETFCDSPASGYRPATIDLDSESAGFSGDGGGVSIPFRSNAGCVASSSNSWLSAQCAPGVLSITAERNDSGEERTGAVFLTAAGGSDHPLTKALLVVQAGAAGPDGMPNFRFADSSTPFYAHAKSREGDSGYIDFGDGIAFRCEWGNFGTVGAESGVGMSFAVSADGKGSVCGFAVSDSRPLAAGGTRISDVPVEYADVFAPGVYLAHAVLDPDGDVDELDETDNTAECRFAVVDPLSLEEALNAGDAEFEYVRGGSGWFGSRGIGADGADGAFAGFAADGGSSSLKTSTNGAGTVSFTYRVSSESGDKFRFYVDGAVRLSASGETPWRTYSIDIGDGEHEFEWRYEKDGSGAAAGDCAYLCGVGWRAQVSGLPPENLSASDGEYNFTRLTWARSPDAVSYVIDRRRAGEEIREEVYSGRYTSRWDDTSAPGGEDCFYRIKALYDAGESEWSDEEPGWCKVVVNYIPNRTVPGEAGVDGIQIPANSRWSATADADWISFDTMSGEGDGKLAYRYGRNATGAVREAHITVSAAPGTDREESRMFKVTQRVPPDAGTTVSVREALDCNLLFAMSGDAVWIGQTRISHDGADALRSGAIPANSTSRVETVFSSGGTLKFHWGTSSQNSDKLSVYLSGVKLAEKSGYSASLAGKTNCTNWAQMEVRVPRGGGVVSWEYAKDGSSDYGEDAAFLDEMEWIPDVEIPDPGDAWWSSRPGLLEALGVSWENRDEALKMQSPGKFKPDGTPVYVWEDFVAGTDPLDPDDLFRATIETVDGMPVVKWSPRLPDGEESRRIYQIYGSENLSGDGWEPVPEGCEEEYRFFNVTVEMR